ncbi:MAG: 30S ribosomal protein S2 [Planctomycetes bacterium]|nr:30S ribosomal protein S2 [Planctomycetota bacterium]
MSNSESGAAVATAPSTETAEISIEMADIPPLSAKALLEAGAHLGHSTQYWDPRMKRFVFGKKSGIYIINVKETLRGAVRARHFLKQVASAGLDVLVSGTKRQAANIVRTEAKRAGIPFVATRWLGGTLTNHSTIRKRLHRLEEIEKLKESGRFARESKKFQSQIDREHRKIAENLEGLRTLDKLPAALLVIDCKYETNAIREARKLNIPVVCLIDTDSNPDMVDIAIPANDDSIRGIQILVHYLVDGILEGKALHQSGQGLKEKGGLAISSYDDFGPTSREKRRNRPGGGKRGKRSGGHRNDQQKADISAAADESVAQAAAQAAPARAAVRVKPKKAGETAESSGDGKE